MTNQNLTGKGDRDSIKKLAYAVNAAAYGEIGCALSAITEARRLSIAETNSPEDDVFSTLSTAVHCFITSCTNHAVQAKSSRRPDFIYVIQNCKTKSVKIGTAKDIGIRIKTLKTGCPDKLVLLQSVPGDIHRERKIHSDLQAYRLEGEWFKWNKQVESYINEMQ